MSTLQIARYVMVAFCLVVTCSLAQPDDKPTSPPRALQTGVVTGEPSPPSSYFIDNASLVLTMDPAIGSGELGVLNNVDVLITSDTITAVGIDLQPPDGAFIISGTGKIVMPGMVDLHNHLWQSAIRGCGTDKPLALWLMQCVDAGELLSLEETYSSVRLSTLDLISTGVTTVADWSHSFTPAFVEGNVKALQDSGLRYAFATETSDEQAILALKKIIDADPLGSLQIAAFPTPAVVQLAEQLDLMIHIHLRENFGSDNDNSITILNQNGALSSRLLAAHCVHVSNAELSLLGQNNVRVAHNPLSNMRLASGIAPLPNMKAASVKVGFGLDGASNDTSDMFATMRVAIGLQRATRNSTTVFPTVQDALRMATLGGAEALHMEDIIGSLTPGKKADLIIINPNAPNFAPEFDWISQLVFNTQPRNVEWVFVNGSVLLANGTHTGTRVTDILRDAQKAADTIKGR